MRQDGNAVDWFLDRHIREGRGERTAFTDPWRSISYANLALDCARFAGALAKAGIQRESRVALVMLDTVDFPIAFWGALRAGVVPVPINTLLTPEAAGYTPGDSRAPAGVVAKARGGSWTRTAGVRARAAGGGARPGDEPLRSRWTTSRLTTGRSRLAVSHSWPR